ncbi:hypothetical protein AB0F59_15840 [Micromonospora lupini]|uniref:hypothetical protein n=1 Tax=Micromonospora lupini TaxID=285679 RepID=UPI0033CA55B4
MSSRVWLHRDDDFRPGAELFRSDRLFALWSYSATHGQLLLRADRLPGVAHRLSTTTEVLFSPVVAVRAQGGYRGLVIRCATDEETERVERGISNYSPGDARVLILESEGVTGHVVTLGVGWSEGILSHLEPSFFNTFNQYDPTWPTKPLPGVGGELDIASPQEVADAFLTRSPHGVREQRTHGVHVLTAIIERDGHRSRHNVGVFLTEADAEEARRLVAPHTATCWIEPLPIVF